MPLRLSMTDLKWVLIETKKDDLGGVKLARNWPHLYVFMRLECLAGRFLSLCRSNKVARGAPEQVTEDLKILRAYLVSEHS